MRRDRRKQYYVLHSWLGALTVVLMFILAFTGAVAVFGVPELKIWAHPEIHESVELDPKQIESLVQDHAASLDPAYLDTIDMIFPGVRRKEHLEIDFHRHGGDTDAGEPTVIRFTHHARTLELLDRTEGTEDDLLAADWLDMADFVVRFHADLHLPNPWGLILTGFLGLTLFASIVTGVVTHRKFLRELFQFRPARSLRLLWTDLHKVLGVWGLLFHTVIGVTGAFLGFAAVVLVPAAALVSFGGDQEALVEAVLPDVEPELSGIEDGVIEFAGVIRLVESLDKGPIVSISVLGAHDRNAAVVVNTRPGHGMPSEILEYDAHTAELKAAHTTYSSIGGASGPILDLMRPLHFGDFGGPLVKALWAVLGIATALTALSGMMIWMERRTYGPVGRLPVTTYLSISRLSLGVCLGLVVGVASLFYSQRLLPMEGPAQEWWMGCVFFGLWGAATAWSLFRENEYVVCRELNRLAGLMCAGVAILNPLTGGAPVWSALANGSFAAAGVDLVMLFTGAGLLSVSVVVPRARPDRRKQTGAERGLRAVTGDMA